MRETWRRKRNLLLAALSSHDDAMFTTLEISVSIIRFHLRVRVGDGGGEKCGPVCEGPNNQQQGGLPT